MIDASGIYVHESGDRAGETVVFLQGSAVSGSMWRHHMSRLADFHCLAPDLPGFGRSRDVPFRSRLDTAELIAGLIERHAPSRRAHIVALSWGGGVAHGLLARRPDLLDRVLIDGAGLLRWRPTPIFLLGIAALTPLLHTRPVISLLSAFVGGLDESGKADIRAASRRAFRRSFVEGFHAELTREELRAPCPTLLVAGEKERSIRRSNAALAALMPNATARYVRGAGHGWLGSRPELHMAMVAAWLRGEPLPAGLVTETISWPRAELRRELRLRGASFRTAPAT